MTGLLRRYAAWLHGRWPAGTVEKLPEVREDGSTSVPGVYVSGDLTGVPLLKFALDSGARVARRIAEDPRLRADGRADLLDLVIVGAGVSGVAAAVEARRRGLAFRLIEATEPFSTIVNFPKQKPIFTYPSEMKPAGEVQVRAEVHPKEALLDDLRAQAAAAGIEPVPARAERIERAGACLTVLAGGERLAARRVLVAIGRGGSFRRLGVSGEDLPKVLSRLHDPAEFAGRRVLVVGGGDTAIETAIALARGGADVTLSYRKTDFARPKPDNVAALRAPGGPGRVSLALGTEVAEIREGEVVLKVAADSLRGDRGGAGGTIANDVVFTMIGREPPLDFFRRSGVAVAGEMTPRRWAAFGLFLAFCALLYDWKAGGRLSDLFYARRWFPTNLGDWLGANDPRTPLGTLQISASAPSFWYTLAYSLIVVVFGVRRIRRRATPYVTAQTLALMAVQVLPLFLIPEVLLPLAHHNGLLPAGLADALFPACDCGHGREFWRAYGFVLAWPLMIYNVLTHEPIAGWLAISAVQTLVLVPLGVRFFGKGAYCGWVCPCGALAETLGDAHRHKMPHGPAWNRLNMAGQAILAIAVVGLGLRVCGWLLPDGNWIDRRFSDLFVAPYKWTVDVTLAGVVGLGCYFWWSGRVWCRFFCPLAALMHVYARFSRFAILADKKKCISCNLCTSACHQGIDVMSFAVKGLAMTDPECVRCSACVGTCPTGVLEFGRAAPDGTVISTERLRASPVRMREARVDGIAPGPST